MTVRHICCGVACCIEESYSRLKTCRGRVSVTRLIKIALTLRHVYCLLDIHSSSPMRYWTHLRRASYVVSDSTDSRLTCGRVAMVTLPQGEARCCFMGTETDIIVLSNCERLVTNILNFLFAWIFRTRMILKSCMYRKICSHQILLINKVLLLFLQWYFKTFSNYHLTQLNSKTSSLMADVFPQKTFLRM